MSQFLQEVFATIPSEIPVVKACNSASAELRLTVCCVRDHDVNSLDIAIKTRTDILIKKLVLFSAIKADAMVPRRHTADKRKLVSKSLSQKRNVGRGFCHSQSPTTSY